MSFLAPLLEVQDLDLAADAARARSAKLPEREAIPLLDSKLAKIETGVAEANADRAAKETEEEQLAKEVAQIVRDIEAAEVERYSGKRKNQDEAADHNASQQGLHEKQTALEEREMELLEEIEVVEGRIEAELSARAANRAKSEKVQELIRKVEEEVAAELGRLVSARTKIAEALPKNLMAAYERVRGQAQRSGRGAATLSEGRCGGCQIKLPSLEKTRMLAEPEEALIQCPQCRRVLVR
jgi:predicted  nucleic acid-binding Zn-ribbon protein